MADTEYTLRNPLARPEAPAKSPTSPPKKGVYDAALAMGADLHARPLAGGGPARVQSSTPRTA